MFINNQLLEEKNEYILLLKLIASLSRLNTDSNIPYLYYRVAENIFCRAFGADNLSRSDISIDAQKTGIGVGLKTFLHRNGSCLEKIAEFNRERNLFSDFENKPNKLIDKVAELRNKRLIATSSICHISQEDMIYHCVSRTNKKINIYETSMDLINIENIGNVKKTKNNTISFNDGLSEYSFNLSKSTLFKRFDITPIIDIDVNIMEDPFEFLKSMISKNNLGLNVSGEVAFENRVILPLYSSRGGLNVPLKSGLNQWNAEGRLRDADEVYIPIPIWIHKSFAGFFPQKDVIFNLHLPTSDKKILSAKVCQENNKALMSNPNKALGKWILRDILKLKEGELATYEMLQEIGSDSVEIEKIDDLNFSINFKSVGSYADFEKENNIKP